MREGGGKRGKEGKKGEAKSGRDGVVGGGATFLPKIDFCAGGEYLNN